MRALCGAIITAAALIAMGLTAQGIGTRYAWVGQYKPSSGAETPAPNLRTTPDIEGSHVKIHEMDNGLKFSLVLSALALAIGLGITFVGLMYHHFRRFHEHLHLHGPSSAAPHHHHAIPS